MNKYKVSLLVTEKLLPDVLRVVAPECKLLGVEPQNDTAEPPAKPYAPRTVHYANGKKNKGISGTDLVLNSIRAAPDTFPLGRHLTRPELEQIFVKQGFASASVSPALTNLVRQGKITYLDGIVRLK